MFFSVIVPVYQAEKTIQRCLDSILKQQFNDYEVILVDDGSSDRSRDICNYFTSIDDRFSYIRKNNSGPSAARNRGLDLAQGEYVVFLDSDDCYRETYLKSLYKLIEMNRDFGHFWCGYITISDNLEENSLNASLPTSKSTVIYDRKEIMTLHRNLFLAPLWNKAYKNSVIKKNHLRMKETLSLGEDILFNLAYLDCCPDTRIIVWNYSEYEYYCFSKDSLNHRYRSDLDDIYRIIRNEIYYCLKKWRVSEEQFTQYETMTFYMLVNVIWNYESKNCALSYSERKHLVNDILNSNEFQKALCDGNITIHPLLKKAYKTKKLWIVKILYKLQHFKSKLIP